MEFKFGSGDHKAPCCQFPSSRQSYTIDHSLLRGEAILRELEKEQIRREIISGEIVRRRMLEEEVRRELMVERELALRSNLGEKLLFDERLAMGLNPRLNVIFPNGNQPLEERTAFAISREFDSLPTKPRFPVASEIKPAPENNKNNLIILAKPDPDLYKAKRKAGTPPDVGREHSPSDLRKKAKEDWSCALCQVSVTSEKGLNEHLQGKKHKAKESALRTPKIGLDPRADDKSSQDQPEAPRAGINQTAVGEDLAEIKAEAEGLVQENQNEGDSKKQNGTGTEQVGNSSAEMVTRKFKFWCEVCRVGSFSQVAMERHKKGKKHMKRLKEFGENDGSAPPTSTFLMALGESSPAAESSGERGVGEDAANS